MWGVIILLIALIIRIIELYLFIKKVSATCNKYDWAFIDKHGYPLVDLIKGGDTYYVTCSWSAYNFLFLKGPHPLYMFFFPGIISFSNQYTDLQLNRLAKHIELD